MEAVPRLPMISFDFKISPQRPDFSTKLRQLIRERYGEDPDMYMNEIHDLETLRPAVSRELSEFTECATLKRYYCQLHSLSNRFPLQGDSPTSVSFVWCDLFTDAETSRSNIDFEMACILYNIGALHTRLGAMDSRVSAEGMKVACSHFQCAAWAFQHLREKYSHLKMTDLTGELLDFMSHVCLAQAQECILEKSMIDHRKSHITAKVTVQIVDYYKQALRSLLSLEEPNSTLPGFHTGGHQQKEWEIKIQLRMHYLISVGYLYQGMQAEEKQQMGVRITYYQAAQTKLEAAFKAAKAFDKSQGKVILETLRFTNDVITGKLTSSQKENDFVYHEKVPAFESLPELKGASLVKGISFDVHDPEVAGHDIFSKLVPIEAHEAASLYSEEKAKILRDIAARVEESNNELQIFMASLQLEYLDLQDQPERLPQELVDRVAAMSANPNAVEDMFGTMNDLTKMCQLVQAALDEIKLFLKTEEENEKVYQAVTGTRPPSMVISELAREAARCEEAHSKADESNKALTRAIRSQTDNVTLLTQPLKHIQTVLPTTKLEQTPEEMKTRNELNRLRGKVEEMRSQRSRLEQELRDSMQNDDITRRLVMNSDKPQDELFRQELSKHDHKIEILEQNLAAQNNILRALTEAHAQYAETKKKMGDAFNDRELAIDTLIRSHMAYQDLTEKLAKGQEFYQKLQQNVQKLVQRVRSVCKVQEEERDTVMKKHKYVAPSAPNIDPEVKGPTLGDYLKAGYRASPENVAGRIVAGDQGRGYPYQQPLGNNSPAKGTTGQYPGQTKNPATDPNMQFHPQQGSSYAEGVPTPEQVGSLNNSPSHSTAFQQPQSTTIPQVNNVSASQPPFSGGAGYQMYTSQAYGHTSQGYSHPNAQGYPPDHRIKPTTTQDSRHSSRMAVSQQEPNNDAYPQNDGYGQSHIVAPTSHTITYSRQTQTQAYTYPTASPKQAGPYSGHYQVYASAQYVPQNSSGAEPVKANQQPSFTQTETYSYGGGSYSYPGQYQASTGASSVPPVGSNATLPSSYSSQTAVHSTTAHMSANRPPVPSSYTSPSVPSYVDPGRGVVPSRPSMPSYTTPSQPAMTSYTTPGQPSMPSCTTPGQPSMPSYTTSGQPSMPSYTTPGQPSMLSYTTLSHPSMPPYTTPSQPSMPSYTATSQHSMPSYTISGQPSMPSYTTLSQPSIPPYTSPGQQPSYTSPGQPSMPSYTLSGQPSMSSSISAYQTPNHSSMTHNHPSVHPPYTTASQPSMPPYTSHKQSSMHSYTTPAQPSVAPFTGPTQASMPSYTSPRQPFYTTANHSTITPYGHPSQPLPSSTSQSTSVPYGYPAQVSYPPQYQSGIPTQVRPYGPPVQTTLAGAYSQPQGAICTQASHLVCGPYTYASHPPNMMYSQANSYYINNPLATYNDYGQVKGQMFNGVNHTNTSQSTKQLYYMYPNYYQPSTVQDGDQALVKRDIPQTKNQSPQHSSTSSQGIRTTTPSSESPVHVSKSSHSDATSLSNVDLLSGIQYTPDQDVSNKRSSFTKENSSDLLSESGSPTSSGRGTPILQPKILTASDIQRQKEEQAKASMLQANKDPFVDSEELTKFASEVESLEKDVEELNMKNISGQSPLDQRWKELMDQQEQECRKLSISVARCYPMKNKFPDILPYDYSRVDLPETKDDYINASHVKDLSMYAPEFIVTQTPLSSTISDFWAMVWSQGVETILCMLPPEETNPQYWPNERGEGVSYGQFKVALQSTKPSSSWIERILSLTHQQSQQARVIVHLQFLDWPHSTMAPANPSSLLHFISEVLGYHRQQRFLLHPIVVHCLAGVGRSGVVLLLAVALALMKSGQLLRDPVPMAVNMSKQRRSLIQTKEQLGFCYKAILHHSQDILIQRGILSEREELDVSVSSHKRTSSSDFILSQGGLNTLQTGLAKLGLDKQYPLMPAQHLVDKVEESSTPASAAPETVKQPQTVAADIVAQLPPHLAKSLDPAQFSLGPLSEPKASTFPQQQRSLKDTPDPNDPLSQLDPLWTMKK